MLPRWSVGTRTLHTSDNGEEYQRLIPDSTVCNGDEFSEINRGKPKRSTRKRKDKEEDSFSDEDGNATLLPMTNLSRPPKPPPAQYQCIEVDIQPGSTLASISLKYNIRLSELKRVNNLLTENEFFALKKIKIPVKPSSLLTEILPSQNVDPDNGWIIKSVDGASATGCTSSSVPSTTNSDNEIQHSFDEDLAPIHASGSPARAVTKNTKKARIFLKNLDKDLKRIKEKQEALMQTVNEERSEFLPVSLNDPESEQPSSGSIAGKCGLVFIALVVVAVVVILVIAHHETFEIEEEHHRNLSEFHSHQMTHH